MRIIYTLGLPASGKSTWSLEYLKSHPTTKRINKDDLRNMIDGGKWTHVNEKVVLSVRDDLIRKFLDMGYDVIVDDTNFNPKHVLKFHEIAEIYDAVVVCQDFTQVDVEECVRRDLQRPHSVGEKVIRGMHRDYLEQTTPKVQFNPNLPSAIICDLDGTLALHNGRSPYDFTKVSEDSVNQAVKSILDHTPIKKIFVSGRDDSCEIATHAWLRKAGLVEFDLHMRKTGDKRKDSIVKKEIFENEIKPHYNISYVLDDRNQVVEMWRSLGLICLQVAEGDF